MKDNKLGAFDIDGVVYQGHLVFDLMQFQESERILPKGFWRQIEKPLNGYKSGVLSYKQAANRTLSLHAQELKGKSYKKLVDYSLRLIRKNKSHIFPYFEKLNEKLKKQYDIYFVTNNYDFVAQAFTDLFDAEGYLSSKIGREGDMINGELEFSISGNKGIVSDLVKRYGKNGSFAVGDSENDIEMLSEVENPFVMEPNENLAEIAKKKNWQVVDRDSITGYITNLL